MFIVRSVRGVSYRKATFRRRLFGSIFSRVEFYPNTRQQSTQAQYSIRFFHVRVLTRAHSSTVGSQHTIESVISKRPYLHKMKIVRKRKKLFLEIKIKFR
jgi:hypothetical protein